MVKILIVDDDAQFCHLIADCLERELAQTDVTVLRATSAGEARRYVAAGETLDIVLADHRLGAADSGLALLEELHAHDADVDSVLFTALHEPAVGMRAYEIGAFRYLAKPFDPHELVWIVRALLRKRSTHYERTWLETLNQITARTQQAVTLEAVAGALVQGGLELGFERARLYVINEERGEAVLTGHTEAGPASAVDFRSIRLPVAQTRYARQVYAAAEIQFFDGHEMSPSMLTQQVAIAGYPPAVGPWVSMPLMHRGRCSGILSLDNAAQEKALRSEQRNLLHLFAQQASAAWERVLSHEREQQVSRIVRRIVQSARDGVEELQLVNQHPGEPNFQSTPPPNADTLLDTLYEELQKIVPTANFVVAIKYNHIEPHLTGWLHYWLHVEDGQRHKDRWRSPVNSGLVRHFIENGVEPHFFPCGTLQFRQSHAIRPPLHRVAQGWIGIPLRVGGETFGAVIIEEYEQQHKWTPAQYELAVAVVQQVTNFLQTAWVNQQRARMIQQLTLLQSASDRIMTLARQQPDDLPPDEWLWHVTLTLATAHYGFGFDRAMLFLLEEGGSVLRGRMGIGHLIWEDAEIDWKNDEASGMDFERYMQLLKAGALVSTPLDARVKSVRMSVHDAPAFRRVAEQGIVTTVSVQRAAAELSEQFVERFGLTAYSLIPARAGSNTIGIIALDAVWDRDPPQTGALGYLDTLTNEAALISENLRKRRVQKQLIELNHQILAYASQLPLKQTLRKIAVAAQLVSGADSVSIYPLSPYSEDRRVDVDHIIWIDRGDGEPPHPGPHISTYMQAVLDLGRAVRVADVFDKHLSTTDFSQDPVVQLRHIRSFVAVPILDSHTGQKLGLLYLNYRWAQEFDDDAIEQAESFANLVSVALRNWREAQGLRSEKQSREDELRLVGAIQRQALNHETKEEDLIETLLSKTRELLDLPDISVTCVLKDWEQPEDPNAEPFEIRKHYGIISDRVPAKSTIQREYGLTGMAMCEGRAINAYDVSVLPWCNVYEARIVGTCAELDVPIMRSDGIVLGVINVESPHVGAFTQEHEQMLKRLSLTAIVALDSVQRRTRLQSILHAVKAISGPTDMETTLNEIVRMIQDVVPDISTLTLWHKTDPDGTQIVLGKHFGVHNTGVVTAEAPQRESIVRSVMESTGPIWGEHVKNVPLLRGSNMIERERLVSTAAFPLHVQGAPIGALFFSYRHHHRFTDSEKTFFPILAEFIAIAINDALILEKAHRERQIAEAERRRHKGAVAIAEAVGGNLDLQSTLEQILEEIMVLFPGCRSCLLVMDEDERTLNFMSSMEKYYQVTHEGYRNLNRIPLDQSSLVGGLVLLSEELGCKVMSNIPIVNYSPITYKEHPDGQGRPFPAHIAPHYLPLNDHTRAQCSITFYGKTNQKVLGGLVLESSEQHRFSVEDEYTLWGVAKQIQFALERQQLISQIRFQDTVASMTVRAAGMAHSLNREIGRIRKRTRWLQDEFPLPEQAQRYVNEIEGSAIELVEVSRHSQHEPRDSTDVVDMVALVEECVTDFLITRGAQARPTFQHEQPQLHARVHASVLRNILCDLMRNSLEAMDGQQNQQIIVHTAQRTPLLVELRMEDTGPGISDGTLRSRILQEPFSTKGKDRGLGLVLARYSIECMQGRIRLLPYEPGRGTAFAIQLPAADPPAQYTNGSPVEIDIYTKPPANSHQLTATS